ncbi:MAG TPA: DUF4230 domain-containing protein [Acidimicrobiia bacterium]|jgi:hypothetical protein|nr:DUF4230 domain-containing protein [Acidimicrobiia bacterium]
MRSVGRLVAIVLVLGLVGLTGYVGVKLASIDPTPEVQFERVGPATLESIRELADLTTVEMVQYTTVEKGSDRGWLNWASGDRIYMFAVAKIGAGVDLAALDEGSFVVDQQTGGVLISLPAAKITYVSIDNEASHVYDRETGVFTKGDPNLEKAARLAAEEILVQAALDQGIIERAEDAAGRFIGEFLKGLGYTKVTVVTA